MCQNNGSKEDEQVGTSENIGDISIKSACTPAQAGVTSSVYTSVSDASTATYIIITKEAPQLEIKLGFKSVQCTCYVLRFGLTFWHRIWHLNFSTSCM
jgi:hypothetical protein